jgi:GxxExxY protein
VALEHKALTQRIIGAAIEVHKVMGPGYIEAIYENALAIEMKSRGISYARQVLVPIFFRTSKIGVHRLDFFIEDEIVVELKASKALEDIHFAVVKSYLRAVNKRHGLLLNFAKPILQIKRVLSDFSFPGFLASL